GRAGQRQTQAPLHPPRSPPAADPARRQNEQPDEQQHQARTELDRATHQPSIGTLWGMAGMEWPRIVLRLVLGRRLPRVRGRARVSGLEGTVTIRRDRWG